MSKKMNLVFTHMKEAETARNKMSEIQAGKKNVSNTVSTAEAVCECGDNVFDGYSNFYNNTKPTPKPKPNPDPPDISCGCGGGYEVFLGMWW